MTSLRQQGSTLTQLPHEFLQPSPSLHSEALSIAKQYLDPLARDISHFQQVRQQAARRKRKRGGTHTWENSKPLALRQLHTDGFEIDQIWAQAKRILDATTAELNRAASRLPERAKESNAPPKRYGGDEIEEDQTLDIDTEGDQLIVGDLSGISEDLGVSDEGAEGVTEDIEETDVDFAPDGNEEVQEPFAPDRSGLNDGFFSIDDFNRQSDFLEQQDARGEDDDAASDEEDVDWGTNPLVAGANETVDIAPPGRGKPVDLSSSKEDGPIFGNVNLDRQDDSDLEGDLDLDGATEDIDGMQNTDNIMYRDFFEPPPRKLTKSARRRALPKTQPPSSLISGPAARENDEDMQRTIDSVRRDIFEDDLTPSEADSNASQPTGPRSSHQKRQAALTKEIRRLEAEAVAKKPWTMSGEARAADRPLNSLLEEDLEFERAGKPVPVITQEVSEDIETLTSAWHAHYRIRERRKERGVELDDGKPTQNLAEIYEAEHLKNADPEGYVDKLSEIEKKEHEKIEALWKDVSAKLDALCNLNFRPKPLEASVNVVTDVPTIMMEDARPNAGSEVGQSMLAPQEVYKAGQGRDKKMEVLTKGGLSVGREEMTREEKLRRRRREKERIKKAGGVASGVGKGAVVRNKKADEKEKVVKDLKRGGVKVIGRKGEIRDTEGRETKASVAMGKGAGGYKL
ncbi:uncharacterized protein KY384_007018 [Bacidia gigantensis]|uniref:uncharacterized protein n=1 Tax=Bacidia gigantensis TaxID=2732470 RepID=UPI001D0542A1|nr:uncharacterized protein KY384_007018 [Bacidia gigantensis]KAG8528102.1 hypothetical protein KY384_007018 [Bacidia gigantensis]